MHVASRIAEQLAQLGAVDDSLNMVCPGAPALSDDDDAA